MRALSQNTALAIARVWRHREKVEWEAAGQFGLLAAALDEMEAPAPLVDLATKAEHDEVRHAGLCRGIVEHLGVRLPRVEPAQEARLLGPAGLSGQARALYASLALSCITETLSTALLLAMQDLTQDPVVLAAVRQILKDEVGHSRIGWAHLAWEKERSDVTWLSPYIARMVEAALSGPTFEQELPAQTGESFGILAPERARALTKETLSEVVFPGLALYGIRIETALFPGA